MIYYTLKISKTIEGNYNIKDEYYFIDNNNLDNDNDFYKYNFANSLMESVSGRREKSISSFILSLISNPLNEFLNIFLLIKKADFTILFVFETGLVTTYLPHITQLFVG